MKRLLLFNLVTDADHPVLGFTTVWINALARHYVQIDVVTMQQGRLAVAENVSVYSVGREKGHSEPRRALAFYNILWRLLRTNHYDACFAHMQPLFALLGWPLLAWFRLPITLWYAHKHIPTRVRMAEKVVDHIVTSSMDGFRLPSDKVTVVGQGIDTEMFSPAEREHHPFTLISVGRIAPVKRIGVLIEAAYLLAQESISFKLSIVGDADAAYLHSLREQVKRYHLEECVDFPGGLAYDRVAEAYRQADAMVNASATGSIDKAVLEAMACGLPVITANEAFQSILQTWSDQLLLPHDAPDDEMARKLAHKVKVMIALPADERRALGLTLRQVVIEQHSLERLTHNLLLVLNS